MRLLEDLLVLRLVQLVIQLLEEGRVGARREARFFVQEREDTEFAFDHIDTRLVVGELDERPVDLLANVLVLLKLEDVRIELGEMLERHEYRVKMRIYRLLELLVGVVDTELLEGVLCIPNEYGTT